MTITSLTLVLKFIVVLHPIAVNAFSASISLVQVRASLTPKASYKQSRKGSHRQIKLSQTQTLSDEQTLQKRGFKQNTHTTKTKLGDNNNLWQQFGDNFSKCDGGAVSGLTRKECQGKAVSAGHDYYSFTVDRVGIARCKTTFRCDSPIRTAWNWKIYRRQMSYIKLPYGAASCPKDTEIRSFTECTQAIDSFGIIGLQPMWKGKHKAIPRWCSLREGKDTNGHQDTRGHFGGADSGGVGRADLAPICYKKTESLADGGLNDQMKDRLAEKLQGEADSNLKGESRRRRNSAAVTTDTDKNIRSKSDTNSKTKSRRRNSKSLSKSGITHATDTSPPRPVVREFGHGFEMVPLEAGAACLDGTPYVYTLKHPNNNTRRWTIWTDGGGFCSDAEACLIRSFTNKGSSNYELPDPENCGCLNFDADGTALDCNCVRLLSCDGGMFTGNRTEPVVTSNGSQLFTRGRRNVEATFEALLAEHGLADASQLVISGTSAGAVASILFLDQIATLMPTNVAVHGVPEGGFTIRHKNEGNENIFLNDLKYAYHFHNSKHSVSTACTEKFAKNPWNCLVIAHAAHYVETPIFFLNSRYDSWQLGYIYGLSWGALHKTHMGNKQRSPEEPGGLLTRVLRYGGDFMKQFHPFAEMVEERNNKHAAFLTSCICHTDDCNFLQASYNGTPLTKFLGEWFLDHRPGLYVERQMPNYDCCMSTDDPSRFACMD